MKPSLPFPDTTPSLKRVVFIQDALLRGMPVPEAPGILVCPFSTEGSWRNRLIELAETHANSHLFVHCSLPVARWIGKQGPERLRYGLSLPDLRASVQMATLGDAMLNDNGLFCPFGLLDRNRALFMNAFGPDLFLRPDSHLKPFAGRPMPQDDWDHEMNSMRQIERVDPAEMCFVGPMKAFHLPEWRFWVVEGKAVAKAPYAFNQDTDPLLLPPPGMQALAEKAADACVVLDHLLVVDVCLDGENIPRVMELNAMSTSGFYPGVDFVSLWSHLFSLYE